MPIYFYQAMIALTLSRPLKHWYKGLQDNDSFSIFSTVVSKSSDQGHLSFCNDLSSHNASNLIKCDKILMEFATWSYHKYNFFWN